MRRNISTWVFALIRFTLLSALINDPRHQTNASCHVCPCVAHHMPLIVVAPPKALALGGHRPLVEVAQKVIQQPCRQASEPELSGAIAIVTYCVHALV